MSSVPARMPSAPRLLLQTFQETSDSGESQPIQAVQKKNEQEIAAGILEALSQCAMIGCAVCDTELRFVVVNDVFAKVNKLPIEKHLGKTIREVLGDAGPIVEPAIKHVLSTGEVYPRLEIVARLPRRERSGRWLATFFPVYNFDGTIYQVGSLVFEVSAHWKVRSFLAGLAEDLPRLREPGTSTHHLGGQQPDDAKLLARLGGILESAINLVRANNTVIDPRNVSARLADALNGRSVLPCSGSEECDGLTEREIEVLKLLANGKVNKEIADILSLAPKTVETYRARIMWKLNVHSVAELVRYAVRHNLIVA